MRILLTNDDGIRAPGIVALHEALRDLGEIVTIAPLTVQSATSHGITYTNPLMTETVVVNESMEGLAVDGRPADCVKVALRAIWSERFGEGASPDLTISGMNCGANVGINILYSGTVAAAIESAFLGVPAIAVSLRIGDPSRTCWSRATTFARLAIDRILEQDLEPNEVLNLNIPCTETPDAPMPPIRVVDMNAAPDLGRYDRRVSPAGQVYYWASGDGMTFARTAKGSDVEALDQGCITVTPLSWVLTSTEHVGALRDRLACGS